MKTSRGEETFGATFIVLALVALGHVLPYLGVGHVNWVGGHISVRHILSQQALVACLGRVEHKRCGSLGFIITISNYFY